MLGCTGGPRPERLVVPPPPTTQTETPSVADTRYAIGPGDLLSVAFLTKPYPSGQGYLLQPSDTLLVEFHRNEHLNRNVVIRPDGRITVPYIGDVEAAGKSADDLSKFIAGDMTRRNLFNNPDVTVSVVGYNSRYRELQSAVSNPSTGTARDAIVDVDGQIRLPLLNGVLAAGKTVTELERELEGRYASLFPCASVMVDLKESRSNVVYVVGEVNTPGLLNLRGPATVSQIIAQAGGFKQTAGLSSIVLVRADEDNKPIGRIIDVSKVLASADVSADAFVRRYDLIYVPPSRIQKLNEVVLYGIRNMMPVHNTNFGFSYLWGDTASSTFKPF